MDKDSKQPKADCPQLPDFKVVARPMRPSILASMTHLVGMIATFVGAILAESKVSDHFKEVPSHWALPHDESLLQAFKSGIFKLFDPKQWKSSVTFIGTVFAGIMATELATDAVEQNHTRKWLRKTYPDAGKYGQRIHAANVSDAVHDGTVQPAAQKQQSI
jgi:hypothetical protein